MTHYNLLQHVQFLIDEGLFTDTGVHERDENERRSENDSVMKTVSKVKGPEIVVVASD